MPSYIRGQRDELKKFVGKKVTIGTSSYHYISGRVDSVDPDDNVKILVGDGHVLVPIAEIATIQESPASQAEYVK